MAVFHPHSEIAADYVNNYLKMVLACELKDIYMLNGGRRICGICRDYENSGNVLRAVIFAQVAHGFERNLPTDREITIDYLRRVLKQIVMDLYAYYEIGDM